MTQVIPHLTCRNAAEAYEFYQRAFGAQPMGLMNGPNGLVMHASLGFEGAPVYLHDEFPDHGVMSPQAIGGTPVTIHLQMDDCDAVYNKAVEAGCAATMPLADMFWGDRFGMVTDPYGHQWSVAITQRTLSPEETRKAMEAEMGSAS